MDGSSPIFILGGANTQVFHAVSLVPYFMFTSIHNLQTFIERIEI